MTSQVPAWADSNWISESGAESSNTIDKAGARAAQHAEDCQKLRGDLDILSEKVHLYVDLLANGLERNDDMMLELVAYLEACEERLRDVVEAGARGDLPEDLFETVLKVNDTVQQTLESNKNGTVPTPALLAATASSTPKSASSTSASGSLLDLDDAFTGLQIKAPPPVHAFSSFTAPVPAPALASSTCLNPLDLDPPSPIRADEQANPMFADTSLLSERRSFTTKTKIEGPSSAQVPVQAHHTTPTPPVKEDDFDAFLASLSKK